MTPNRSRTIALAFATLALGILAAGPALGALSASPNPSTTGSYTVSDASPPALSADVIGGVRSTLYTYNLVETPSGGTAQSYGLGRGPVSRSFTGKSTGTYSYQLQTCVDVYELDGFDFTHISNTCTDSGSSLTVTVGTAPPPDLMPDFGTASVTAKSWTQNAAITSFTVPAATGGDTPLSYSASGLPAGVSMSSARLISGTPTTAGSGTATVTVTDDDDDTDTLTFTWTVAADLVPDFGTASVADQSWILNRYITFVVIPAASGGDGTLTYSGSGLPAGLRFLTSTRTVLGRPTAAGSGTFTVTVTDADGDTDTLSFDWTVVDLMPDFGTATVSAKSWTQDTAISAFTVPAATNGNTPLSYTATGLPAGVSMSSARRVSGTPTAAGNGTATVTVSDADGDTDTLTFDWTVAAAPDPEPDPDLMPDFGTASVTAKSWTQNAAITAFTVPAAMGGDTPLSYTATGLPAGVTMSSARRVSGTPTASGSGTATVTVTDDDGDTDTLTFTWSVAADLMPDFGTASVTAKSWKQNAAITAFTVPAATGGDTPLSYTASGLPTGVTMSSARRVSGTPTAAGSGTATVTVTDDDGDTDTLTFTWTVAADLMPDFGTASVTAKRWTRNAAITAFTVPAATGGDTPLSYTASGLPAGVTMSSTRRVSGTPTAAGSGTATVTVTDDDGDTDTLSFTWTVTAPTTTASLTASPNPSTTGNYTVSHASPPALPANTVTNVRQTLHSYNLVETPPGGTAQSHGLGRGPVSKSFTGKSSGTYAYQLQTCVDVFELDGFDFVHISNTCTNSGSSLSVSVTAPDRMPDYSGVTVTAKSWTQNTAITAFTVPAATGGDAPLSYAASGLPTGITMSSAREVSGTPTTFGSGTATVTVTDDDGDTATLTFGWTVARDLMPDYSGVNVTTKRWIENQAITAFTVGAASGGDTPLSYTASGLPAGVTMSSARQVSGTPTATGSGTATVTVTDKDGDTDTLTFGWTVDKPETGTVTNPHLLSNPLQTSALNAFSLLRGTGNGDSAASATYFRFTVPNHRAGSWSIAIDGTPNSGVNWDLKGDGDLSGTSANSDESGSVTLTAGQRYNFRVYPATATARTSLTALTVTLSPPTCPIPTAPDSQTWIEGVAITGITVPEFGCGAPPVSYSASGLPTGVTMSSARLVSGTPTATDSGTAVVTMTDSNNDTDTLSFAWKVEADTEPTFPVDVLASRSWNANAAITGFTVPSASGGNAPLTYTASGLPSGVSMSSTRMVSGTPTTNGTGTATVTVTDADGDVDTLTFTWAVTTVNGGLTASPNPSGTGSYTVSHASPPALPADQVTNVLQYLNTYNLVETPAGGAAQSHGLGRRRVSKLFTGKSSGTYVYQLQTCLDTFEFDGSEFVHRSRVCTNSGNPLSVTVDLMPDFSGVTVPAQSWTQNQAITAFTVGEANGGDTPLSYTASGLPAGVTMSSARQVSGTPTATGSGTATVTATDSDGDTATLTFDWTVNKPETGTVTSPHLLSNPLQTSALNAFGLLRGTGNGDSATSATYFQFTVPNDRAGSWSISIDGTPDSGANWELKGDGDLSSISANADESGSVTLTAGQRYNFRVYPATATARTSLTAMTVTLTAPTSTDPMFPNDPVGPHSWVQNQAITAFTVPAATGGDAPLSYTATGLPTGVSMSSARLVSGTPTATGTGTATVTVTDSDGDTDTLTFDWSVVADRMPDYSGVTVPAKSWTQNTAIVSFTVPTAMGGNTPLSYTATGLPTGVSMSSARQVSGTPTATGSGTATVTVTDDDGDTDTLTLSWTVTAPTTTGSLTASPNPSATGSYTVSHASPPALPVDTVTNALQYLNTYNLVETPSGGTAQSHSLGRGPVSKTFTGKSSGTYAYQLQTCVDTYDFDGSDFVHRNSVCTNSGSALSVTVDRGPDYSDVTVAAQSWPRGQAIIAFTIPAASGDAPLTYRISGEPAGITINSQTSELSGTPTTNGSGTATVTATDNDGDIDTLSFTWTVEADTSPMFSVDTLTARTWAEDAAIAEFTVPAATGGNVPLTYSISGEPAGIEFEPETRKVSGTPTTAGSGTATVTVKDNDGDTDTLTFTWTVVTPPPVPGRPTGPDTDTDGAYAIAWSSTNGAVRYELQESFNGGAWTSVPTTGTATTKSFTGKASGEHLYRVRACNASVCSDWSPLKILFVNRPPTVGFDSTYVVRTGDLGSDGDTDVYLSPTATGTGNVGEFILENDSGTFTLDTSPTLTELAAAQSWTVSTQQSIVVEDVNVDGVWDAYVTGIEGNIDNAVNQIVISPKTRSAVPTGLVAVDADLKSFLTSVKAWYQDLDYFDETLTLNTYVVYDVVSSPPPAELMRDCRDAYEDCRSLEGGLLHHYSSRLECFVSLIENTSLFLSLLTQEVSLESFCDEPGWSVFGVLQNTITVKDLSSVREGVIFDVAKFINIWESGSPTFEVEDLADVLEDVLGIQIVGQDEDTCVGGAVQRVCEIHQALLNVWALLGGENAEEPDENADIIVREPNTVYVTRRRVGGLGWLTVDFAWHAALEYTYPILNSYKPTIAAYEEGEKLVSRRNDISERNNLVSGTVTSPRHLTPVQLWLALVESERNYDSCPPLPYAYFAPVDEPRDRRNSNGFVAGIINSVQGSTAAPISTYWLGNYPVPLARFQTLCVGPPVP